jgi:hypothetical protein
MLTNEAVNRMLEVYKPLDKAQVLNGSSDVVGEKNIFWTNPNNKRISVQPFFITSVGANKLNKLKLSGRTSTGTKVNNLNAQDNEEDMRIIMNKKYPSNINNVGFRAVYGGTKYDFVLFKSSDLSGIQGIDDLTTGVYNGGETINQNLYQFLWDTESQSLEDRYLNIKLNVGTGYINLFSLPVKFMGGPAFNVNENSYLEYDLSKYTTGDINTTESTNSYFENLTEGIEML